ncbi:hypothetical protein [Leucobacter chinensis]|uniref:hypothetical protein n=1 Tax=Leucobacter chinensis TaxID=2851010 RepID=UPI001C246CDC|nr:hypothetical protein [Leucobacter chinensis]
MNTLAFVTPLLWSAPLTARFGVDEPRLTLTLRSRSEAMLLQLIHQGTTDAALDRAAEAEGVSATGVSELLDLLEPVLATSQCTFSRPAPNRSVTITDRSKGASQLAHWLLALGVSARLASASATSPRGMSTAGRGAPASTYLTLDRFAYDVGRLTALTARGFEVLPVLFTDTSVTIGPVLSEPPRANAAQSSRMQHQCPGCFTAFNTDALERWGEWAGQLVGVPLWVERGEPSLTIAALATMVLGSVEGARFTVRLSSRGEVEHCFRDFPTAHPSCTNHGVLVHGLAEPANLDELAA